MLLKKHIERLCALLLTCGASLMAGAPAAHAAPPGFRFCSMDVDFPPYARVDGSGHLQYLMVQAARSIGMQVERHVAPRRRCLEEIKAGLSDGMIAAYSAERAQFAGFPMAGSDADDSRALGVVRYYTYRRSGSALEWDGKRFAELGTGVIGVESGFILITDRLRLLEVRFDEGGKSLEQNMAKLVLARFDGVIAMDLEADKLIAARFAGKVERAGKLFEHSALHLMLSRQFVAQYPKLADAYWQAIADYRASSDYRSYQQKNP
jgi:polar amino acid transport system substrate-binding protein